jgi:hypothetical protein
MDLTKPLLESIILQQEGHEWKQQMDYEGIPLKCQTCHEHGHLLKAIHE